MADDETDVQGWQAEAPVVYRQPFEQLLDVLQEDDRVFERYEKFSPDISRLREVLGQFAGALEAALAEAEP